MTVNTPRPIITLLTDFGHSSPYVAQMKGVLLARNPELQLVDISHEVPPQDVRSGAVVLDDVCRRFPPHSIHIAVVDPGVGTNRQIVFARIGEQRFIAPDNGLLTLAAQRVAPSCIVAITNRLYFLPEVSATFHGRDIMAPVAAHLSLGLNPERLGDPCESIITLPLPRPIQENGRITGAVLQIDRFGNVITNILASDLFPPGMDPSGIWIHCRDQKVQGLVQTYGDRPSGELVALIGSNRRLELAVVNGNAAQRLSARLDDEVLVEYPMAKSE